MIEVESQREDTKLLFTCTGRRHKPGNARNAALDTRKGKEMNWLKSLGQQGGRGGEPSPANTLI